VTAATKTPRLAGLAEFAEMGGWSKSLAHAYMSYPDAPPGQMLRGGTSKVCLASDARKYADALNGPRGTAREPKNGWTAKWREMPELADLGWIRTALGVSKQRAGQIVDRRLHPGAPEPQRLADGPAWLLSVIEEHLLASGRERTW